MDCFKDVEWSMGESGHRRARVGFRDSKAVIRGDNDFISNSRRSLQRLAISPRTLMTYTTTAALYSTAKFGSPVCHALHAALISSAPWPTETETVQARSRQVDNTRKPWTER